MRKFNAILSMAVLALFLFHVIAGSFQLFGASAGGSVIMKAGAFLMLGAVVLHAVIGIKLTVDTFAAMKKSGKGYLRENKLFWIRRISGFAIMLFIASHVIIFLGSGDGAFRLNLFDVPQLVSSLLLVLSVLVHVVTNIRPLMLALGARSIGEFITDAAFILSLLLLVSGAAFVVYFIRWSV